MRDELKNIVELFEKYFSNELLTPDEELKLRVILIIIGMIFGFLSGQLFTMFNDPWN